MNPWDVFVRSEQSNIAISRADIAETRTRIKQCNEDFKESLTRLLEFEEFQLREEESALEEYIIKRDQWTKDQMLLGKKIDRFTKSLKFPDSEGITDPAEWMRLKQDTLKNIEHCITHGIFSNEFILVRDRIKAEIAAKLREVGT